MNIGIMSSVATCLGMAASTAASAAFVEFAVTRTEVTSGSQALSRFEVFATFSGSTDTLLNVFNFQALGGWAGHTDAASGFWHKDNADSSNPGQLSQTSGTWSPQQTGSATANRPFDSFLLIGGNATAANTTTADPSWNGSGANPASWNAAQLPLYNDLGWFNSSPPNLQGRVGTAPNSATQVKVGQFMLSTSDNAYRWYSLTVGYNNGTGGGATFGTASFQLPAPGAIALLGLAGLAGRRRR